MEQPTTSWALPMPVRLASSELPVNDLVTMHLELRSTEEAFGIVQRQTPTCHRSGVKKADR
ncbi:hypothetical protein PSPO01_04045 [Paraphaeosphaeria sporulosa]